MKCKNPKLRLDLFYCIIVLGMTGRGFFNQHITKAVRHFQLNRKFKVSQVKIETCSHFIVKIRSLNPDINRFCIIKLFFTCKVVSEIKASYNIGSDIIQSITFIFEQKRKFKK